MKQKVDFLKDSALFKHLPDEQLAQIANIAEIESHAKNHIIFLNGDKAENIYIIISGWVKRFRTSFNGEETILDINSSHISVGDIAALGQTHYVANAQAITPTKVLKIPYKEFIEIVKRDGQALETFFKTNAERQNKLVNEIEHLITCTAHQRIGLFLLDMLKNNSITTFEEDNIATIALPYAKSLVALQLGMQAETFSRAFAKLKTDNLISAEKRHITINNITNLKNFCRIQ